MSLNEAPLDSQPEKNPRKTELNGVLATARFVGREEPGRNIPRSGPDRHILDAHRPPADYFAQRHGERRPIRQRLVGTPSPPDKIVCRRKRREQIVDRPALKRRCRRPEPVANLVFDGGYIVRRDFQNVDVFRGRLLHAATGQQDQKRDADSRETSQFYLGYRYGVASNCGPV